MGRRVAGNDSAARHRGSHRAAHAKSGGSGRAFAIGGVSVLLVVGGALAGTRFLGDDASSSGAEAARCGTTGVTIATTAGLAPPLRTELRDRGCDQILVEVLDPNEVATALVAGTDVPDYWIPDSRLWVERVAGTTDTTPETIVDSVAESPVVLASAQETSPDDWLAAMTSPDLLVGDPLDDGSSAAPLMLATTGVSTSEAVEALAPQAQRQAAAAAAPKPELDRLQSIDTANAGFTTASEQAVLSSGRDLTASVPAPGTWMLTYPLVETASGARAEELAATTELIKTFVGSPGFAANLANSHFRVPRGGPVKGGVGKVTTVDPPQPEAFGAILSSWATLAVPTRTLAVIDVSGSMDFDAEQGTRIDLTVAATSAGLDLFPNGASVGLWAFSQESDGKLGGDTDYEELVPVRRLDAYVDGLTQREQLLSELGALPSLTDGGTGLHDTTLAAYEAMLADYDRSAVNSILLFSDGANDDPGSPSLDDTVSQLQALADPGRPISIITIGISEDADATALERIAEATGGFSIVARQPEDMGELFQKAMAARFS